jgi:hypothetical protein
MNMTDTTLSTNKYRELATLIAQQKALDETISVLKDEIFSELVNYEGSKLETDFATFSIAYRPKWEYSPELQEKVRAVNEKVKFMKKEEEKTGKAVKISDNGHIRIQLAK